MRIAEIFESIQGEGQYAGTESVFVRTTGCNLRCWFCDTPYTSWNPEGEQCAWHTVYERVQATSINHVVVTGGEPMLQPDVVLLTRALAEAGRLVTIETAGTVYRPVHADLMSISPKLGNSTPRNDPIWKQRHERLREQPDVVTRMLDEYLCQFKFVIDDAEDLIEVDAYLSQHPQIEADRVFLMPQAITAEQIAEKRGWLEAAAAERNIRVSPRLHIEMFGNARGT